MLIREEGGQAIYHIQPLSPVNPDSPTDDDSGIIEECDASVTSKNGSVKVRFDDEDNIAAARSASGGGDNVWGRFMKVLSGV